MNWKLIVWEVVSWAVLLLSLWKLRRELPHPPVKRCDECGWCGEPPEELLHMFCEDELLCHAGRGTDFPLDDGEEYVSVTRAGGCCDCWIRKQNGGGRNA